MAETIKIGGELESVATGGIVAAASAIKDKTKNKTQDVINAEVDASLEDRYTKEETYSKTQLDSMITTPDTPYIDVDTYAELEALTEHPAGAIYRVANYDGTQVVTNKYSEYSWDGTHYKLMAVRDHGIDNEPTAGSNNLVKSGGVQNELALGAVYDVSAKNPTAGPNNDGKFTLEYILDQNNVNTLIPTAVRKGGMSIKFVHRSDNKYVQYRYMGTATTGTPNPFLNTDNWSFCGDDVLTECPEYMAVYLDADRRIIKAVKNDGTEYFAVGVETETLKVKNGAEVYGKITTDGVEITMMESPEFMDVYLDSDKKILFGVQNDGNFYFGCGVPRQIIDYVESKLAELSLDEYEDIVTFLGTLINGDKTLTELLNGKVDEEEGKGLSTNDYTDDEKAVVDTTTLVENPEYMDVELDSENKVVGGRKSDGTKFEKVGYETPEISIDDVNINTINDPEDRVEINLDKEKRIVSYRKSDGTLVEPRIELDEITYSTKALSQINNIIKEEFKEDIKENGMYIQTYHIPKYGTVNIKQERFYLSADGWTSYQNEVELRQLYDETEANSTRHIAISRFFAGNTPLLFFAASKVKEIEGQLLGSASVTKVNGTCYYTDTLGVNPDGSYVVITYSMQATVQEEPAEGKSINVNIPVREVNDVPPYKAWSVDKKTEHYCLVDINFGYYLTKNNIAIGIKYQGASTLNRIKRNFRFTFYKNNSFAKKDKIKIGELIRLSGYNLKANVSDNSRVKEMILYRILLDVWERRPVNDRFPWDKEFGYYTGATGFIEGFPIRTNIGGVFYGMHTFSLKKDEKNYMLNGEDSSGIFVCGSRRDATCWTTSVASDWEDEMMDEMTQDTADALNIWLAFINDRLYKGSDNNEYLSDELTDVDGTMYVSTSLVEGEVVESSISATLIAFDKDNAPERMDVLGFIDYFLCMQAFLMWDSICRNMILHSRSDKKKFYPYFYDVDLSLNHAYNADIFDIAYDGTGEQRVDYDMSFWSNLKDLYWDEIVNRWCVLRNTILTTEHLEYVFHKLADSIPDADYIDENNRWGYNTRKSVFYALINKVKLRFEWLDENYFIV